MADVDQDDLKLARHMHMTAEGDMQHAIWVTVMLSSHSVTNRSDARSTSSQTKTSTFISWSLTVQKTMMPAVTSEHKACVAFIGDIRYAPSPNFRA